MRKMIDYEKLKVAHALAEKCESHFIVHVIGHNGHELNLVDWRPKIPDLDFKSIDDLIAKLQELTKPKPKYEDGEMVWAIKNNEPYSFYIISSNCSNNVIWFYEDPDGTEWHQCLLFPTRQALIEHQLQYWRNILEDELEQHVSPYCEPLTEDKLIDECEHEICNHEFGCTNFVDGEFVAIPVCKKCGDSY